MQLVYIYGPPGVGKLTIARELVALTRFKLFHNHLAANLAASIFAHQSEPYFRLIRRIWRDTFAAAVEHDVDLVCTAVYRGRPEHDGFIRWMLEPIYTGGGSVAYVQLTCAHDEWLRRIEGESRHALNKLVDPQAALALAERVDLFARVPFQPSLSIDSTSLLPTTVAMRIADYFNLPTDGSQSSLRSA
jgi:hypothetical protein